MFSVFNNRITVCVSANNKTSLQKPAPTSDLVLYPDFTKFKFITTIDILIFCVQSRRIIVANLLTESCEAFYYYCVTSAARVYCTSLSPRVRQLHALHGSRWRTTRFLQDHAHAHTHISRINFTFHSSSFTTRTRPITSSSESLNLNSTRMHATGCKHNAFSWRSFVWFNVIIKSNDCSFDNKMMFIIVNILQKWFNIFTCGQRTRTVCHEIRSHDNYIRYIRCQILILK